METYLYFFSVKLEIPYSNTRRMLGELLGSRQSKCPRLPWNSFGLVHSIVGSTSIIEKLRQIEVSKGSLKMDVFFLGYRCADLVFDFNFTVFSINCHVGMKALMPVRISSQINFKKKNRKAEIACKFI